MNSPKEIHRHLDTQREELNDLTQHVDNLRAGFQKQLEDLRNRIIQLEHTLTHAT